MSRAAKLTLTGTSIGAIAVVVLVHYQQNSEKAVMHAGVIRDIERQRVKKERQADFEMQKALEEEYRKVQQVHDGDSEDPVSRADDGKAKEKSWWSFG